MVRKKTTENIAIVPARSGSKRVENKNIREMCGKPLIAYTIEAAIKSQLFDRIIVTTDCEHIATISEKFGAEVPFLRSKDLADDHCPVSLATLDAVEKVQNNAESYANVAQLMANCPLRDENDVISSYKQFVSSDSDSQISIMKYGWQNPWWAMEFDDNFRVFPIFEEALKERSQDLPEIFAPTGAIWWSKTDSLSKNKTFHIKEKTGWEISIINGMDIDTKEDWDIAEMFMKYKKDDTNEY